jgi:SAM-dependent methyltransferase
MPGLDTQLHVNMLRDAKIVGRGAKLYGMQWGNPQKVPHLRAVRTRFVYPYLNPDHVAIEIGPGGGRWTRYLLSFGKVYAVEYYQPLLDELARNYHLPHLHLVKNNGTDFPGVADASIDFVFSFGVFVHLDMPVIEGYLQEIKRVLKPGGNAILHYSDKRKEQARRNRNFSDNDPERMRAAVTGAGFRILEEEIEALARGAIVRFTQG